MTHILNILSLLILLFTFSIFFSVSSLYLLVHLFWYFIKFSFLKNMFLRLCCSLHTESRLLPLLINYFYHQVPIHFIIKSKVWLKASFVRCCFNYISFVLLSIYLLYLSCSLSYFQPFCVLMIWVWFLTESRELDFKHFISEVLFYNKLV